jgi:hypothetical protein
MIVAVDLASPSSGTKLADPEDFTTLKLICEGGGGLEALKNALAGLGSVDEDGSHVWLAVDGLKTLAGRLASEADWIRRLDGMLGYAGLNGWLSEDGTAIRAHIERA